MKNGAVQLFDPSENKSKVACLVGERVKMIRENLNYDCLTKIISGPQQKSV